MSTLGVSVGMWREGKYSLKNRCRAVGQELPLKGDSQQSVKNIIIAPGMNVSL